MTGFGRWRKPHICNHHGALVVMWNGCGPREYAQACRWLERRAERQGLAWVWRSELLPGLIDRLETT